MFANVVASKVASAVNQNTTKPPSVDDNSRPISPPIQLTKTQILCNQLRSQIQNVSSTNQTEINQMLETVKQIEGIDASVAKISRRMLSRKMSAFNFDKEIDQQSVAMGFDLDESTLKHVQHFTGLVEQDSVRHSSAHVIARLKHAVKHTVVMEGLKHIGSDHMIRLLKEKESEGSHKLHKDLDNIDEWGDFNIFHLLKTFDGDRNLTVRSITIEIIESRNGLLTTLGVNQKSMLNYINKVCETYNDVPYHNCIHGGDVLQSFHCLLVRSPVLREATPPTMMFACLMAALVHDVGHVGRTNHFLVNTSHALALKYNDQSVLENMHIALALQLTTETACNIFEHFAKEDLEELRSVWITMILGTDMAHHVRGNFLLQQSVNKAKDAGKECIMITPKQHVTMLGYLLHACDLSNPTKPFPIYNEWTGRVMQEFFAQSSEEKEKGIEITLPEKETANIPAFQIGFIRFITPFFEALHAIKDIDMAEQLSNLKKNLEHWTNERKKRVATLLLDEAVTRREDSETKGKEDEEKGRKSPHEH